MMAISENIRRQVEQAREAERVARRVAREHPDPEARRVYAWIAERAAARVAARTAKLCTTPTSDGWVLVSGSDD